MKKIEVFDPALCCSSGFCGPSPDQQLVAFASVVKALDGKADVRRYNLAQEPTSFSIHSEVKKILEEEGTASLPVILVDGKLAVKGFYPSREQLEQLAGLTGAEDSCCGGDAEGQSSECCEEGGKSEDCCQPEVGQGSGPEVSCCG